MKKFLSNIKTKLFTKVEKEHSEAYMRRIAFLNKYSLLFHALISCALVFIVEVISRRDFLSACSFVAGHTFAFLYNALIVFASLCFAYMFRRRAFIRIIISGFWIILGIINGCILSNRVTPFGFTDLKCIPDLLAMNNTNYFTAEEATIVVIGLGLFALFCIVLFIKGPRFQGKIHKVIVLASIVSVLFIGLPITTSAAQKTNVVASYFSNIAQGSAVFAYYFIKRHDEREAQISLPATISAYLGVTEPALFGVNVKYVYPLVAGMSDSALSGLLSTVFGVQANSIGIGGLLAILSIKPQYWGIFAIIMVVDIVAAMVLIFLFHKTGFLTKTEEDGHAQETLKEASEGLVEPTVFTETTEVISPLAGQVKLLSQATAPVFSSGVMG